MVKSKTLLFYLILFVFKLNVSVAQFPALRYFSKANGLPSDFITSIVQDRQGYLWFSTDIGLFRYDGLNFKSLTKKDGLSGTAISNMRIDNNGRIWLMFSNGTVSYLLDGKIYNEKNDTLLKNIKDRFFFLDEFTDHQNRVWITTREDFFVLNKYTLNRTKEKFEEFGSFVMNGSSGPLIISSTQNFRLDSVTEQLIPIKLKYKLLNWGRKAYCRLSDGSVLFCAVEGIVWQNDTTQKLILPIGPLLKNCVPMGLFMTSDSVLWLSTSDGDLNFYDLKNHADKTVTLLRQKAVRAFFEDDEHNLWIGFKGDGCVMISSTGRKSLIYNDKNILPGLCVAVGKMKPDKLILGLSNGTLGYMQHQHFQEIIPGGAYKMDNIAIWKILAADDDIWVSTSYGLAHINEKTKCNHWVHVRYPDNNSLKIAESITDFTTGDDSLYLVSDTRIFKYPLHCNSNTKNYGTHFIDAGTWVFSLCCDKNNELWYSTNSGMYSVKNRTIIDHTTEDSLLSERINSITLLKDSILLLGSWGYGLIFYKNGKIISTVNKESGLLENICYQAFLFQNSIYVRNDVGVSIVHLEGHKLVSVQNLNKMNYLPSNDIFTVYADEEEVLVATNNGLASIKQSVLAEELKEIPRLVLSEVAVNGLPVSGDSALNLSYHQNSFKINYVGILYRDPGEVNYRYRLNETQDWQTTNNISLEFSFLPPGSYHFQLQSRIRNGAWSPEKSFKFIINPPFWKTWWFRTIVFLILAIAVYFLFKKRLSDIRRKDAEKVKMEAQMANLEQQALQTMMNPHFIFNIMNSIQYFINHNDTDSANRYLGDFATLIRMNLTISNKRFISLDEEIEYLKLYLMFEQLRFGENLTFEFQIDPELDTYGSTIAVMMIQPFIENAIWHGILPSGDKGHIKVEFQLADKKLLLIRVEEDGVGIRDEFLNSDYYQSLNESHALSMTIKRLHLLGKFSPHPLTVHFRHVHPERENKGTIAEILLPLIV